MANFGSLNEQEFAKIIAEQLKSVKNELEEGTEDAVEDIAKQITLSSDVIIKAFKDLSKKITNQKGLFDISLNGKNVSVDIDFSTVDINTEDFQKKVDQVFKRFMSVNSLDLSFDSTETERGFKDIIALHVKYANKIHELQNSVNNPMMSPSDKRLNLQEQLAIFGELKRIKKVISEIVGGEVYSLSPITVPVNELQRTIELLTQTETYEENIARQHEERIRQLTQENELLKEQKKLSEDASTATKKEGKLYSGQKTVDNKNTAEAEYDRLVDEFRELDDKLTEADKKLNKLESRARVYGFGSDKSAREEGRIQSILGKNDRVNYVVGMLKNGHTPMQASNGEYGFDRSDVGKGVYTKITKTEYEFAQYLSHKIQELNVGWDEGLRILESQNGQLENQKKIVDDLRLEYDEVEEKKRVAYETMAREHADAYRSKTHKNVDDETTTSDPSKETVVESGEKVQLEAEQQALSDVDDAAEKTAESKKKLANANKEATKTTDELTESLEEEADALDDVGEKVERIKGTLDKVYISGELKRGKEEDVAVSNKIEQYSEKRNDEYITRREHYRLKRDNDGNVTDELEDDPYLIEITKDIARINKEKKKTEADIKRAEKKVNEFLARFQSKTGGKAQYVDGFSDLQNLARSKNINASNIDEVYNKMIVLQQKYAELEKNFRKGQSSLNPFVNAINKSQNIGDIFGEVESRFDKLVVKSDDLVSQFEELKRLEKEIGKFTTRMQNGENIDPAEFTAFSKNMGDFIATRTKVNALLRKEAPYSAQVEKEIVQDLIELYEELGRVKALGNKDEEDRLIETIDIEKSILPSIDYGTNSKFQKAEQQGFTAIEEERKNEALAERKKKIAELNGLYQNYGVLVERAAKAEGKLREELDSQAQKIKDKIDTTKLSAGFDITPEMQDDFDKSFAKGKEIEENKQLIAIAKKADANEAKKLRKIAKLQKEIGILEADFYKSNSRNVQSAIKEEIKLRRHLIELQRQGLQLSEQDEAYFRRAAKNKTSLAKSEATQKEREINNAFIADEETRLKKIQSLEVEISRLRATTDVETNENVKKALNEEIGLRVQLIDLIKQGKELDARDEAWFKQNAANQTDMARKTASGYDVARKKEFDEVVRTLKEYNEWSVKASKTKDGGLKDFYTKKAETAIEKHNNLLVEYKNNIDNVNLSKEEQAKLDELNATRVNKLREAEEKAAKKTEDADFRKKIKEAKSSVAMKKSSSSLRKSEGLAFDILSGDDYEKSDKAFKAKISAYSFEIDEFKKLHADAMDEIEKNGNLSDDTTEELATRTNLINKYTEEIEELVAVHDKLNGDNVIAKATSYLGTESSLESYEKELTDFVKNITKGRGTITGFDADTKTLHYTIKGLKGETVECSAAVDHLAGSYVALQNKTKQTESFFDRLKRKTGEVATYFMSSISIYTITNKIKQGIQYVREIDAAMTELKKVTNETDEAYERFLDTAAKTGAKLGSTISEFTEATATFSKLGYNMNLATEMAEAAIVYKNVGDNIASTEDAADSIISTLKGFGMQASESMEVVDRFNEIGNRFAITSQGIGEALRLSASALNEGGNSLDESIAMITAAM